MEPVTGIEPAYLAWEASALPLSYTGVLHRSYKYPRPASELAQEVADVADELGRLLLRHPVATARDLGDGDVRRALGTTHEARREDDVAGAGQEEQRHVVDAAGVPPA